MNARGERLVAVTPQLASVCGRNANGKPLVSLTLASREIPVMVGFATVPARQLHEQSRATGPSHLPDDDRSYRTKADVALVEIDRARTAGLRFGYVLADADYGLAAPFRQGVVSAGAA